MLPNGWIRPESRSQGSLIKIPSDIKNILVVRQHNQIGDMLSSQPMYKALKRKYPEAEITLVAAKTNYEIPFKDINPFIDEIIIHDKTSFGTLRNFFKLLRKRKYEIGIVPSTIALSRTSHIINYLSGAKVRVGVKEIDDKPNTSHKYLNIKSSFNWDEEKKHQIERNLDVVRQIGCELPVDEKKTEIRFGDDEIKSAKEFLNKHFNNNRTVIGFHPGAGKVKNIWSSENFIELINHLYKTYNCNVLITSGWTDKEVVDKVLNGISSEIKTAVAHNFPVKKLAALLSQIKLYITNDTGTMHIAGTTNINLISLFGPTEPYEWAPKGKNKYYIKSLTDNINGISIDEVLDKTKEILK